MVPAQREQPAAGESPRGGVSSINPRPSVIFHPAVLRDEGVDHLLHGEVGDELVLGQGTPCHGIKMTHALQGRWPGTGYTACLAPGQQHSGVGCSI